MEKSNSFQCTSTHNFCIKGDTLHNNFDESVRPSPSLFLLFTLASNQSAYPKIVTTLKSINVLYK